MKLIFVAFLALCHMANASITPGELHLDKDLYVTADVSMRNGYVANYNDIKMPDWISKKEFVQAGRHSAQIECRESNQSNKLLCNIVVKDLTPAGKISFTLPYEENHRGVIYFTHIGDNHSNLRLSGFIKIVKSSRATLLESIMNVTSANIQVEAQVFAVEEMVTRLAKKLSNSPYLIGEFNF